MGSSAKVDIQLYGPATQLSRMMDGGNVFTCKHKPARLVEIGVTQYDVGSSVSAFQDTSILFMYMVH